MEMVATESGRNRQKCIPILGSYYLAGESRPSCTLCVSKAMSEGKKSRLFLYGTLEPKDHDLDEVSLL